MHNHPFVLELVVNMKRRWPVFLGFLLIAALTAAQAQFGYMTNAGGTSVTITNYTGTGGAVVIPSAINGLPVTAIGQQAFYDNTSMTSVVIGTNVASIGFYAFEGCASLASVSMPSSVTNIQTPAFGFCGSLTAITVNPNNPAFSSVAGVLFDKGQTTLIQCPGAITGSYTIPNTVTSIASYAFNACALLTSVTVGNSVTNIGADAFYFCPSLTSVTIPASAASIGGSAFGNCTSLRTVFFQGNAPSLGASVFLYDSSLTAYYLPWTTGWGATFGGIPTAFRGQVLHQ